MKRPEQLSLEALKRACSCRAHLRLPRGGRERTRFGPATDPRYWREGEYLDIVPNERIISAGAMHDGPATTSTTLCTIESFSDADGSSLI